MKGNLRLLIADSSEDFRMLLADALSDFHGLQIIGFAENGEEAFRLCRSLEPDILITEVLLPNLDGLGLIRRLKETGSLPKTIIASGFFNDALAADASKMGVEYWFQKPFSIEELIYRIERVAELDSDLVYRHDPGCDEIITEALRAFGVGANLQGFRYLREATKMVLRDGDVIHGVTKILYPDIGKTFHTTAKSVERSIRSAVDSAWRRGDKEKRQAYFKDTAMDFSTRPTNSGFISALADFVRSKTGGIWR